MAESNPLIPNPPVGEEVPKVSPEGAATDSLTVTDPNASMAERSQQMTDALTSAGPDKVLIEKAPDAIAAVAKAQDIVSAKPLNPAIPGGVEVPDAAATLAKREAEQAAHNAEPKRSFWDKVKNVIPIKATPVVPPVTTPTVATPTNESSTLVASEVPPPAENKAPESVQPVQPGERQDPPPYEPPTQPSTPVESTVSGSATNTPDHLTDAGTSLQTGWSENAVKPPAAVEEPENSAAAPAPAVEPVSPVLDAPKDESTSSALVGETIDEDKMQGVVEVATDATKPDPLAVQPPPGVSAEPASTLPPINGLPLETGSEPKAEAIEEPAPVVPSEAPVALSETPVSAPEAQVTPSEAPSATMGAEPATGRTTSEAFGIASEPTQPAGSEADTASVRLGAEEEPEAKEDPTATVSSPSPVAPQYNVVSEAAKAADGAGAGSLTASAIENTAINAWNAPIASTTPNAETPSGQGDPTDPNGTPSGTPPTPVGTGV